MPDVIEDQRTVGSLLLLPRINCVVMDVRVDRNQARLVREPVVSESVNSEFIPTEIEDLRYISFVLLAMFQALEKAIAVRDLGSGPCLDCGILWTPARDQVQISIIHCESRHGLQAVPKPEDDGGIFRIVSFSHIESTSINLHTLDGD